MVTQLNFTETYRNEAGVPTRYSVVLQLTEHPMDVQDLTELQAVAVEPETFTNIPPVPATPPEEDPPPDEPDFDVTTYYTGDPGITAQQVVTNWLEKGIEIIR